MRSRCRRQPRPRDGRRRHHRPRRWPVQRRARPRIVEAVQAAAADMVFFTGYFAEAAKLIRDLRAAGYPGKIMLSDGGVDPALFTVVHPAQAEGVYGLSLPLPQFEPKATAWAARYKTITGKAPGPFTMQAYDAVKLALNAIRRAGSVDRAKVRAAINRKSVV